MYDTLIKNGTVVDGSGGPAKQADIAIQNGMIAALGSLDSRARQSIDATGLTVTPGFVDIHTHYDGQVSWDPYLAPSSLHGVTTAVMGNCGVGFAPVRESDRDWLIRLMEGVEDIPGTALSEGIQWQWQDFTEYLDTLASKRYTMDIAAQIPHGPLRTYVMGERGADHRVEPTVSEIEQMGRLVKEALAAGAVGFSTSRTVVHRSSDGQPIPCLSATPAELLGIAKAMAEVNDGVFELVSDFAPMASELKLIRDIAHTSGRPVSIALTQVDEAPGQWREVLNDISRAREEGLDIRAQVAARPVSVMMGLAGSAHFLMSSSAYHGFIALPLEERLAVLRKPEVKSELLKTLDLSLLPSPMLYDWDHIYPFDESLDYCPGPGQSIAAQAETRGITPESIAYDVLVAEGGRSYLYLTARNYSDRNHQAVRTMLAHEHSILGLGDAGAHCSVLCDASVPTFLLTYWAQQAGEDCFELPWLVYKLSKQPACAWGFTDRGEIRVGQRADINLIDLAALRLHSPAMVHDLPASGGRLMQGADGYVMTLVGGELVSENGRATGALPGRLLRRLTP